MESTAADNGDDEWRFAVDDFDEASADDDDESADDMDAVFGFRRVADETLDRESIDRENLLFVLMGVALTMVAVWQAIL